MTDQEIESRLKRTLNEMGDAAPLANPDGPPVSESSPRRMGPRVDPKVLVLAGGFVLVVVAIILVSVGAGHHESNQTNHHRKQHYFSVSVNGCPRHPPSNVLCATSSTVPVYGTLELIGGPGTPKPVAGSVMFTNSHGEKKRITVGSNGRFGVLLKDGAYFVTANYGPQHRACKGNVINPVSPRETINMLIPCPTK